MNDDDTPPRRPIEANLAQALCWGAPAWILDDGPPPTAPMESDTFDATSATMQRLRLWLHRVRRCRPPQDAPGRR